MDGSSLSLKFLKIGVLKNFAKFTGKHLCWSLFLIKFQALYPLKICRSLFLNKVTGPRPATLLKKRLQHMFF